ncbi:MAG: hypothetical protein P8Y01_06525, partial [Woeseiaceae bacterium]
MSIIFRQPGLSARIVRLLALLCLAFLSGQALASESAAERTDNGTDLLQDSTDEDDVRSGGTAPAAEEMVEAVPA